MNPAELPRSILVVGSGGREHALVRALAASPARPRVLCAPGNAGIADDAACFPVKADDVPGLVELARREGVGLVVVGPEVPLVMGLADRLAEARIPVYGPTAAGARLEASKTYTKQLLLKYGIPTAEAGLFAETAPALGYIRSRRIPIVVKADGLAAGKGVVVAATLAEAESAVVEMIEQGKFGSGGRQILVEDCLEGEETSILVVVSGRDYVILPTSQDHKRIGDGDTGPNTGGMGAYSPAEVVTPALMAEIERRIVRPSVEAIASEGLGFRGTLFVGIMLTAGRPQGPRVQHPLRGSRDAGRPAEAGHRSAGPPVGGGHGAARPDSGSRCAPSTRSASSSARRDTPERTVSGDPIVLPAPLPAEVTVLHAGTSRDAAGRLVTAGGRVLGVTARGPSLAAAAASAYAACESIRCASKYFRRDIGARQLRRL